MLLAATSYSTVLPVQHRSKYADLLPTNNFKCQAAVDTKSIATALQRSTQRQPVAQRSMVLASATHWSLVARSCCHCVQQMVSVWSLCFKAVAVLFLSTAAWNLESVIRSKLRNILLYCTGHLSLLPAVTLLLSRHACTLSCGQPQGNGNIGNMV